MATKTCIACRRTWHIDAFPRDRSTQDGYSSRCKNCHHEKRFSYARPAEDIIGGERPYVTKITATDHGTNLVRIGDQMRSSHGLRPMAVPQVASSLAWSDA